MEFFNTGICSILGDRQTQQDAGCIEEKEDGTLLAVMCDGMGGTQDGGKAAGLAVERLRQSFYQTPPLSEKEVAAWLREQFVLADHEIWGMTDDRGKSMMSGSTVTAVYISGNKLFWGSVGDSRIYFFMALKPENNPEENLSESWKSLQVPIAYNTQILTRSHNYNLQLDALYRNGKISLEDLSSERQKGKALISYLGIGGLPIVDISPSPCLMKEDDIVLLCSDGLYKSLEERQILAVLQESGGDMGLAVNRLCYTARRLGKGKLDNTTTVAVRCN